MGVILGNVLYVTRKCQYRSFIFGSSTILVKYIYGGNFPSKMPKGSEVMLFPGYTRWVGIAGLDFSHWIFPGVLLGIRYMFFSLCGSSKY